MTSWSWSQQQTACPAGHDVSWAAGGSGTTFVACPDCPHTLDDRGHFALWCPTCRRLYVPPDCPRWTPPESPAGPLSGPQSA